MTDYSWCGAKIIQFNYNIPLEYVSQTNGQDILFLERGDELLIGPKGVCSSRGRFRLGDTFLER